MTLKETLATLDAKATESMSITDAGAFIVALELAYRTGQLVVAPSVEELAKAIQDAVYANILNGGWMLPDDPLDCVKIDGDVDLVQVATAILTSMGVKTDG